MIKHRMHLLAWTGILALPRLALAQEPKAEMKSGPAGVEAQVIALEKAAHASLVQGDLAAYKEAIGGTFIFLNPSGTGPYSFEMAEQGLKACRTVAALPSNLQATRFGSDVVVVTSEVVLDQVCGTARGLPAFRGMSVWQLREGRWRLVSHSQTPMAPEALPPEARARIEEQVRKEMVRFSAAARATDARALLAVTAKQDGLCLFGASGAKPTSCREIWASLRDAWSEDNPNRPVRQEFDGEEIRVLPLTPTVAVASWTIAEDRVYGKDGQVVFRAPFADLFVFVLENGEWRIHSGEQAAWFKPAQ